MPLSPEDIVRHFTGNDATVERINPRQSKFKIAIVEYNSEWPQRFQTTNAKIEAVLGSTALAVHHVGSTSIPGMPAKDVIDIDLVVKDIKDEASYVGPLESIGFLFRLREPDWYDHRFFLDEGLRPDSWQINLHVFGPDCPEVVRHQIFREYLLKSPEDFERYAALKRESAAAAVEAGETMAQYTIRKGKGLQEILDKAFRDLGYIR